MSRQVKKVNISGKEDKSNKVTSWSNTTTDAHYPSEKLVKDSLDGKANISHNHDDRYYTESEIVDFLNKKIDLDCEFIDGWWNSNQTYHLKGNSVKDSNTLRRDGKKFIYKVPDFSDMDYDDRLLYLSIVTSNSTSGVVGKLYYNENTIYVEDAKTLFINKYLLIKHVQNETFDEYHVLDIFNIFHNHNDVYYSKSEIDNKIITDVSGLTDNQGLLFSGNYEDLNNKPNIPIATSDLTNDSGFITSHQDISGKEDSSNKVSSWSSTTTDAHYPSEKLVKDSLDGKANSTHNHTKSQITDFPSLSTVASSGSYNDLSNKPTIPDVSGKEDSSNKVSSWSNTTNNTRYPTEKLVKDSLDGKQDELVSGTNLKTLNGVDLLGEGDIAIDVSCGEDSTIIFEDDCSSATGLTHYGNDILLEGGSATTMTYDSTENAYKITTPDTKSKCIPITPLTDVDNFKFEADIKPVSWFGMGFGVSGGTGNGCVVSFSADSDNLCGWKYTNGSFGTFFSDVSGLVDTGYLHITVTVEGTSLDVSITDTNNTTRTATATLPSYSTRYVGIGLGSGTSNQYGYIKNIMVESLGGGSTTIFEDAGSASGVSNYSTAHILEDGGTTTFTLTWDTTENAYHIETVPPKACMVGIDALDGYTGDFKLEADIMRTSTSYGGNLCYCQNTGDGFFYGLQTNTVGFVGHHYMNGIWQGELNHTGSSSANVWYHMELVKVGTTITISAYDSTGVTLLASTSKTYTDDENYYGFAMHNFYFKNVKAEIIGGGSSISLSENTIYLGDDIMTMINQSLEHMITNWEDYE